MKLNNMLETNNFIARNPEAMETLDFVEFKFVDEIKAEQFVADVGCDNISFVDGRIVRAIVARDIPGWVAEVRREAGIVSTTHIR